MYVKMTNVFISPSTYNIRLWYFRFSEKLLYCLYDIFEILKYNNVLRIYYIIWMTFWNVKDFIFLYFDFVLTLGGGDVFFLTQQKICFENKNTSIFFTTHTHLNNIMRLTYIMQVFQLSYALILNSNYV